MTRYFEINENGNNVRCKLYCNSEIDRVVIYGHGFAGHMDNASCEKFAERVLSKYRDVAVLAFNWPCHGSDVKKKLRLEDCDAYLSSVIRYVKDTLQPAALFGYATSFGGYLMLKYLQDHGNPFRKLGLRCPAVNMYDALIGVIMQEDELERIRKGKVVPVGFDRKIDLDLSFLESLEAADIRKGSFLDFADDLLIVHGEEDEVISFDGSRLFAENNVIEFLPVPQADHRFQGRHALEIADKAVIEFFGL